MQQGKSQERKQCTCHRLLPVRIDPDGLRLLPLLPVECEGGR